MFLSVILLISDKQSFLLTQNQSTYKKVMLKFIKNICSSWFIYLFKIFSIQSDEMQNCTKCKEPIVNLKGGIICAASCYGYFHVECTRIATYRSLSKMGSKKLYWKCDACKLGGNMDRSAKKVQVSESVQSKCVFQTSLKIKL